MSFASVDFMLFFALVVGGTFLTELSGRERLRELFLLSASYFFYGYWDWRFCFLLLFVTLVSYFTALHSKSRAAYTAGVIAPLAVLGFFKYFNFFLESVSAVLGRSIGALSIILPVGISFYTFQALSYVIDVHREKIAPERDFIKLALYLSFFPQLVAGPIVRAVDFLPQLHEKRRVEWNNILQGVQIFAFGMFKKIVLADHISVFVDDVYYAPAAFHWASILLAAAAYSLQIYFDFSGYSDMATGCAKCLGYDFNRNFNLPYISENVTEFWRRWHISLSSWLREYLYIPLGGNRKGEARRNVNLFLTMLLGGLWHGASWTFVFWGGLNGAALCLDKLSRRKAGRSSKLTRGVNVILTFAFITFTWIFFRADTFNDAWLVIKGIFTLQQGLHQPFSWAFAGLVLLAVSTIAAEIKANKEGKATVDGFYPTVDLKSIPGLTVFLVFIGLILGLSYTGEQPFVYFQF